jgi:uncharacterized OB-fold protein
VPPPRILPPIDDVNRPFWIGGHDGRLVLERCAACARWQHPPVGRCADCGEEVQHDAVSGRGTVFTATVNHHQFHPEVPPPYVIAIVELVEQADLRIVANIVGEADGINRAPDTVQIGDEVDVDFEIQGDHAVPVFRLVEP